jgi:hypothetical protein
LDLRQRPDWKDRLVTAEAAMLAAIVVVVIATGVRVFSLAFPCSNDDAFIAFRYARNLADGKGPVFNPGERIWGYTSPLQVLVLALLARLGADIPTAAIAIGLLATGVSSWLAFRVSSQILGKRGGLLVGVGLLSSGASFAFLPLETPWVGALLWGFIALAHRERPAAAGLAGALACLARPDSLVLVLPSLAATPGLRRPRALAAFALPGACWLLFCHRYYGHLLPHSFYAKGAVFRAPRDIGWREHLRMATDHAKEMIGWFYDTVVPVPKPPPWPSLRSPAAHDVFMALGAISSVLILWWYARRSEPRLRPLLVGLTVYPWVMIAAYAVIRPPVSHTWEYCNAIGFLVVGMLVVVARLVARGDRPSLRRDVALGAALIAVCFLGTRRNLQGIAAQDTDYWAGARHRHYAAIAAWLKEHAPPGARVAWNEPGTLAYLSGLAVYDNFLVSGESPGPPDYVFGDGRNPQLTSFGRTYGLAHKFPYKDFGPMDPYRRIDP